MKVKQYQLSKTVAKTVKENNLIIGRKDKYITCLLDLSLLDSITLSDIEKQIIINSAIKTVSPANKTDYYGSIIDNFTACDGIATYNCHKVYNQSGKQVYCIMELSNIEHYSKTRKSIYNNNYDLISYTANSGTYSPLADYEIA